MAEFLEKMVLEELVDLAINVGLLKYFIELYTNL